jgi:hypothetical protein
MEPQELDEAKIKAYEAERAKNIAEKIKIEKETEEIEERLKATFLGISFSSYLKTLMAGIVAGALIWTVTVDYPGKIYTAHKNIKEINKLKDETAKELREVEKDKKQVEVDLQEVKKEKEKVEKDKKQVEVDLQEVEKKKEKVEKDTEMLERYNIALRKEGNKIAAEKALKIKEDSEIEKDNQAKKAIAQVHDIENRQSDLPTLKTLKPGVSHVKNNIKTAWLYLGEFKNGQWVKKHFNFPKTQDPKELNGKTILLTSQSINVRTKKLTGDIVKILKEGEKVIVKEIQNYPFTDYVWAEIEL